MRPQSCPIDASSELSNSYPRAVQSCPELPRVSQSCEKTRPRVDQWRSPQNCPELSSCPELLRVARKKNGGRTDGPTDGHTLIPQLKRIKAALTCSPLNKEKAPRYPRVQQMRPRIHFRLLNTYRCFYTLLNTSETLYKH